MSEQEKTHVLMQDCIIVDLGRCEAGTLVAESDVNPSTWSWLQDRNFLKSVSEIESEADSEDSEEQSEEESEGPEVLSKSVSLDVDLPAKVRKARNQ